MIEKNHAVFQALQDNLKKLGCTNVFIQSQDGLEFALRDTRCYDVIFLDPPFQDSYLPKLLEILPPRLNKNGVLYVESGEAVDIPAPWRIKKSGMAGRVRYQLLDISTND